MSTEFAVRWKEPVSIENFCYTRNYRYKPSFVVISNVAMSSIWDYYPTGGRLPDKLIVNTFQRERENARAIFSRWITIIFVEIPSNARNCQRQVFEESQSKVSSTKKFQICLFVSFPSKNVSRKKEEEDCHLQPSDEWMSEHLRITGHPSAGQAFGRN